MELMISFTTALLGSIADFLAAEPMIYLFSIVLLIGIVKVFRQFLP